MDTYIEELLRNFPINEFIPFTEDDVPFVVEELDLPIDVTYSNGASKFVLIPKYKDYVIKIPFTGMIHLDGVYEEYSQADDYDRPWDYCMNEVFRYETAKEDGMEEFFAETKFVGYMKGFPIYTQVKCEVLNPNEHYYSKEERDKTRSLTKYASINVDWLTDIRTQMGEDAVVKFVNYVDYQGWNDDLRADNIGYLNGHPIVVDYSSFLD